MDAKARLGWFGIGALLGAAATLTVNAVGWLTPPPAMTGAELVQAAERGEVLEIVIEGEIHASGRLADGSQFQVALTGNETALIDALLRSNARVEVVHERGPWWGPWLAGTVAVWAVLLNLLLVFISIGFPL